MRTGRTSTGVQVVFAQPANTKRFYSIVTAGTLLAIVFVVFGVMFLAGFKSVPVDMVGLHYTGGPIQGQHFRKIVAPGTGARFYGLLDQVPRLPVTVRDYIISKNPEEGHRKGPDFISSQSKEGVVFEWETATYFKLNVEPNTLRRFYEQVCLRYACTTDEGWQQMLNNVFRQQIENTIQVESRTFSTDDLANNAQALVRVQSAVGTQIKDQINSVLGGPFFCGPGFTPTNPDVCPEIQFIVKKATPPGNILDAYAANKSSQIAILTRTNEVEQAKQQALAARQLFEGIKDNPNYVLLKAIESGKINFWVLPNDTNLTLQGPSPGAGTPTAPGR